MDIFKTITKETEQNPQWQTLNSHKGFGPAKKLLDEICQPLTDKDGNFVQQFQTTGFYQRLWEIFLHSFFVENTFQVLQKHDRPDFQLLKDKTEIFVEACSSNPAVNDKFTNEFIDASIKAKDKEAESDLKDYYTIKIGSILFSKLTKKYWELEWVKSKQVLITSDCSPLDKLSTLVYHAEVPAGGLIILPEGLPIFQLFREPETGWEIHPEVLLLKSSA